MNTKVLVIDQNKDRAMSTGKTLEFIDYEPVVITDLENLPRSAVVRDDFLAVMLGKISATPQLQTLLDTKRVSDGKVPFLMLPESIEDPTLLQQLDPGQTWMMQTPIKYPELTTLLERAGHKDRRVQKDSSFSPTGRSKRISRVRDLIAQVAPHNSTVLVTGESGTGKEVVARAIHENSRRSHMPFVPINCGAIPAELLESELFGHEKGAFTGALTTRKGRFEMAEGGTLFLDEIGDMSLPMQVKLLRVLQERCYERVGGNKTRHCDVRVIAATHCFLERAIDEKKFRLDLFYRLNVFPIELPPLRKRQSDLPALVKDLVSRREGDGHRSLRLSANAMTALGAYHWPGNIRELSNLVERLSIQNTSGLIDVSDLPEKYRMGYANSASVDHDDSDLPDTEDPRTTLPSNGMDLREHLSSLEKDLIRQALDVSGGTVAGAARLLNLGRTTLVEKLRKYKMSAGTAKSSGN
ncbi:MAG: sigma-54-dependent Fis family transcriptional regulator [Gammaproteobacteria bacterium]|nr:sigma-54-dependent Fis family transcriptional regulator [Gammaproteobacteria bacterium]